MMKLAYTLFAAAAFAASAQAKPFNGADCVAFSEPDLAGATIVASHNDDATTKTNKLSFAPKSLFVADGYAVKAFEGENFQGQGELDGGPSSDITATDGGHYVNIGSQYIRTVRSFACVKAGKLWTDVKAFRERGKDEYGHEFDHALSAVYYPGQTFATSGAYHAQAASVSVDEQDGHKLLTFSTDFYYANGYHGTIDLDTGAITYIITAGSWPHGVLSTQVITQTSGITGIDFQYKGALDSVISLIDLAIDNGTSSNSVAVPNLELKSIRLLLTDGFRTL